jgi:hypothetical protein
LNGRWEPPHFLLRALVIVFTVFSNISWVQECATWEDEYCVSSAIKTTLNKLLSGVGNFATYFAQLVLQPATRGILSPLPIRFISRRISTTYIYIMSFVG